MAQLTYTQISTILNAVNEQATGKPLAAVNMKSFQTMATTLLQLNTDTLLNAISSVVAKTIIAVRPHKSNLRGMLLDEQAWGDMVRRISFLPVEAKDNEGLKPASIADGQSIDHYEINKMHALQFNFYGGNTYTRWITRFNDSYTLHSAFSSEAAFSEFFSGMMMEFNNQLERDIESEIRACMNGMILAVNNKGNNVRHLLTEYNAATGSALTATSVMQAENFKPFYEWLSAEILTLKSFMETDSLLYHENVTGKELLRSTDAAHMRAYMISSFTNRAKTTVAANTFHEEMSKIADFEEVAFWQSPTEPMAVQGAFKSMKNADGTVEEKASEKVENVIGFISDTDAMGVTILQNRGSATPLNARGLYSNLFNHRVIRCSNDMTMNFVLLCLD